MTDKTEQQQLEEQQFNAIFEFLGVHDNSIFQLLAAVNVIKSILIDSKITTDQKIAELTKRELKKIEIELDKFISTLQKEVDEPKE